MQVHRRKTTERRSMRLVAVILLVVTAAAAADAAVSLPAWTRPKAGTYSKACVEHELPIVIQARSWESCAAMSAAHLDRRRCIDSSVHTASA